VSHDSRTTRHLFAAFVVAIGVFAWSRGLDGPYHFDDFTTPLGDPASQSLSAWQQHAGHTLRPLTKLTYALEAESPLTNTPWSRRLVSISLHVISAGLLLLLIRRLAPDASPMWGAVLVAVWFLHPVHADAVLLASGRSAELSNLFVIAALVASCGSRRWLAAFFFGLACASRETAIAALLPLAALAAARMPGRWRAVGRELGPSLAIGGVIVFWLAMTPRYRILADYSMLGRPFWSSVIAQVSAVPVGLALLFQPSRLSIDYGIPLADGAGHLLFLIGVLLYSCAAAAVVWLSRRSPAAAVGLSLWVAALLPTQSVVPKLDALSNRPLSLALAGMMLAAAPLVQRTVRRQAFALAAACVALTLTATLSVATAQRADLFRSDLRLWQDAAAKSRVNERPYIQYAILLRESGKPREALDALSVAARINPFSSEIDTLARAVRRREITP
jgi:hypothetical protein